MMEESKLKVLIINILNQKVKWCYDFQRYCKFFTVTSSTEKPYVCLLDGAYTNNMLDCPNSNIKAYSDDIKEVLDETKQ